MKKLISPALTGWLFSLWHWPSPETTEWFCLRAALWWVIQLAPCLHLFGVSSSFDGLAHYGPEVHRQILVAGLLAVQVLGVCLGNIWIRVGTLSCFGALWAFFAGMFWASSPHLYGLPRNTGIGIYFSLAVDCMIVAIHLVKLWYIDHLSRREEHVRENKRAREVVCLSRSS
jgi:hypothetical protein